jgi:drug/metabolite transporter (DMT)-like permease
VTESNQRLLVPVSLFLVYVVWGSTYLALKWGLDGFPPFVLNGIRLVVAGVLLYAWARWRGRPAPTRRQWLHAFFLGGVMFIGGMGLVTVAEDNGVGSGLVAAAVAVMPLWAALWAGALGEWPTRFEWLGLAVGFAGVVMLSREGDFQASTLGLVLMILAPIFWAFGSVVARRLDVPTAGMASATQMFGGGVLLLVAGFGRGEAFDGMPALGAWFSLGYLIVFGSVLTFSAYIYLLANTRAAVATSYAYVNPVVAVVLGVTLGGEVIGVWTYAGLPVILLGVALVGYAQRRRAAVTAARTAAGTP